MVFLDMYNCMVRRITLAYDYSYNVLYYPMETSRIYLAYDYSYNVLYYPMETSRIYKLSVLKK